LAALGVLSGLAVKRDVSDRQDLLGYWDLRIDHISDENFGIVRASILLQA